MLEIVIELVYLRRKVVRIEVAIDISVQRIEILQAVAGVGLPLWITEQVNLEGYLLLFY